MRRRRSCRCRFVRCRTGRARREPAGWPGIDRSGCRVAFCGERAKDRRGKSKVGETGQVGNGLSVSVCRQCVRVNALRGRETTRAIRAVQMSAGDKDRSASTVLVVRSRRPDHVTQQEHEHCTANMLVDPAGSSVCDILGRESRGRQADDRLLRAYRQLGDRNACRHLARDLSGPDLSHRQQSAARPHDATDRDRFVSTRDPVKNDVNKTNFLFRFS
jgi:hypothetical protein